MKYHLHTIIVNDSMLNPNKYLLAKDIRNNNKSMEFTLPKIVRRDTTVEFEYIIPEKSYVDFSINNFDTTGNNKFHGYLYLKYGYKNDDSLSNHNNHIFRYIVFDATNRDEKVLSPVPRYQGSLLQIFRRKDNVESLDSVIIQPSDFIESMSVNF